MADTIGPYSFSGFLDNLYTSTDHHDMMTLTVSKCNYKPEKPLEERQAIISRVRDKNPDKIPVVIVRQEDMISLVVESNLAIGDLFTMALKEIYNMDQDIISNTTHRDPTAEKLISSIYNEHKDEDGCLYLTLTGYMPKLLAEANLIKRNQNIVEMIVLYKLYHSVPLREEIEKLQKGQPVGRLGCILCLLWILRPRKKSE